MLEKRFTVQQQMAMALVVGFAAGAIFANFPGRPYVGEIGILSSSYREYILAGGWDLQRLFGSLLVSRLVPAFLMVALSFTRWRLSALRLYALWAAFSFGSFWAACLLSGGISSIFVFFMALFPHGLLLIYGWLQLGKILLSKNRELPRLLPHSAFWFWRWWRRPGSIRICSASCSVWCSRKPGSLSQERFRKPLAPPWHKWADRPLK